MKFALIVLSVLTLTFTTVMLDTWAVNQVLDLDGSRDYVEIPPSDSLDITGAITLEGWVFHKDAETADWAQAWLSKYTDRLLSWNIRSDGFFIAQDMWEEDMLRYGAPKDEWFHIACVYDSQKQKVYLNGELAAERDWPGFIASSHSPVKIGTFHTQYWPGMLDEVRIWNLARTHEEIRSTMNAPLTGDEPGLAGYWNFDDGTADDLSPSGNHGALEGSTQIIAAALPDSFTPANAIGIETTVVNPSETFTTNISASLTEPLYRFTFDLKFDPALLKVVDITEGNYLSRNGIDTTVWEKPHVDNEKGVIAGIRSHRATNTGAESKKGILAIVTFEAKQVGSSNIYLENLRLVSTENALIAAHTPAGVVDIFPHGRLSGTIIDADDKTPISGARIQVSNRWCQLRHIYSDREGRYTLNEVPVGEVKIKVARDRAYSNIVTRTHVKLGEMRTGFDFELKPYPTPEIPAPGEEPTRIRHEEDDDEDEDEDL